MLDNKFSHNQQEFNLQLDLREAINEDPLSYEAVVIILQCLIQFQPEMFTEAEFELLNTEEEDITIDDTLLGQAIFRGLLEYNENQGDIYLPKAAKRMFDQYDDDMQGGLLEADPYTNIELQILQNRLNQFRASRGKH